MDMTAGFFQAVGYLRIPQLLAGEEVDTLTAVTRRIVARFGPSVTPDRRTRIDNAVSADPAYLTAASSDQVIAAFRPILGPDIELVENRHNHVTVYPVGSTDRLHRDVLQWSRSILTVLLYLSDCTETAAATRVVPGSHLWPSLGAPNNGGTWLDQSTTHADLTAQAVAVPAAAGDAVLLHGQLYHCGAGAGSTGPRIVFTLAYRSADELSPNIPSNCRLISGQRAYRGQGAYRLV
jgi:ectoine hydroxylase-related dioxygenase (phytanoyl-CoA dioxygenase family)